MTKFESWLRENGVERGWFERQIGVSWNTMQKIIYGGTISLTTAKAVECQTKGAVTVDDMCVIKRRCIKKKQKQLENSDDQKD